MPAMHLAGLCLVLVVVLAMPGCATTTQGRVASISTVSAAAPAAPDPIDDPMREGCFDCLRASLDAAMARGEHERAFEAASLLAIRAKELGMPSDAWRDLSSMVRPSGAAWDTLAEIVAAVPADPLGGDREVLLTQSVPRRQIVAALELWRVSLRSPPGSPLFRAYLDLSLACPFGAAEDWTATVGDALARLGQAPLLLYRVGFCGTEQDAARLRTLRADHPRLVEADYALGRLALQSADSPDEEEALRRFRSAAAAFPASSAILTSIGQLLESQEDWEAALDAHDAALALVPTHRDSLLGRTIALSNLLRRDEAIASATRLIDLGNWFIGQAYYWRAWNQYHLGRLDAARADADRAKAAVVDAAVLVLSGMTDWRQRRRESAEREFGQARRIDAQQCEAASFQAAVQAELGRPDDALATFVEAEQCFDGAIERAREAIAALGSGVTGPQAQRQREHHTRTMAHATSRREEARLNQTRLRQRLSSLPSASSRGAR